MNVLQLLDNKKGPPVRHMTISKNKRQWTPSDYHAMTLTRFIIREKQEKFPDATGEFIQLLVSLQTAVKIVSVAVRKAGFMHLLGTTGAKNTHGEDVKKLDLLANELFINLLKSSYTTTLLVSEENHDAIKVDISQRGHYIVCFDPLDGSSNVDTFISIGSIFGVYRKKDMDEPTLQDALQPGGRLVAAGYAIYGSATKLVISTGLGVNGFILDPSTGEFMLTKPQMKIPQWGKAYSANEGHYYTWPPAVQRYVEGMKREQFSARYVGSMVADVHRILCHGGIFLYPATGENPKGKLRMLYECNPIAFIITQAGGAATDGNRAILEIQPIELHERSPIYLGSKDNVTDIEKYLKSGND